MPHLPCPRLLPHLYARQPRVSANRVFANREAIVRCKYAVQVHWSPSEKSLAPNQAAHFLFEQENECPINRGLFTSQDGKFSLPYLPRKPLQLTQAVKCGYCGGLHEDIANHPEHLCGHCGRDIPCSIAGGSVANPLMAFRRVWRREVVGDKTNQECREIHLWSEGKKKYMMWPSTPAVFWSRDAPEVWGVHVHEFDERGVRTVDNTYGHVYLDGKKLDRGELFA